MKCSDLLKVIPAAEPIRILSVFETVARGEAGQVEMELPNCLLDKKVEFVYFGGKYFLDGKPCITICLGGE